MNKKYLLIAAAVILLIAAHIATTHATVLFPSGGGLGTNIAPASGTIPIGNGSGTYTPATLTPGTNVTITNGSGTITIAATGGSSASTTVIVGINGVTVTQVGSNATATLDTTFAASWAALETFLKGILVNGSTTLASSTNCAVLTTNASGTIQCGTSNVVSLASSSQIAVSAATGTGISFSLLQSYLTAAITQINGASSTSHNDVAGAGIAITSTSTTANSTTTFTNTGVTSLTGNGCVGVPNATGTITLSVTCISGNQTITFTIAGDATGTASGATSITDTVTVTGLNGKVLPTNTTGTLQFSAGAWKLSLATSSLGIYDVNGVLSSYVGSSCTNQGVTGISPTGTVACATFATSTPALPLSVANGGTGTSTTPTDSQILSASGTTPTWKTLIAGTNVTIATSSTSTTINATGGGGGTTPTSTFLNVTPTSTVMSCNFPFYTANGTPTVSATSSICEDASGTIWFFSPKLPHVVIGTTTAPNNSLFYIASSTPIFNVDANGNVIIGNVTSTNITPIGPLEIEINGVDVLAETSSSVLNVSSTINQSGGPVNIAGAISGASTLTVTQTSTFNGNANIVPTSTVLKTNASGTIVGAINGTDFLAPNSPSSTFDFLGSTFLTAAANSTTVLTFPAYAMLYIGVKVDGYGGGGDIASLQFNGDTGNDYNSRYISVPAGTVTVQNTQFNPTNFCRLFATTTTQGRTAWLVISNDLNFDKNVDSSGKTATGAAATAPTVEFGGCEWATTTQITSLKLTTAGAGTMNTSSGIQVFGRKF